MNLEEFHRDTLVLEELAARLETIDRRHRVLATGFARLERTVLGDHELGRAVAHHISRLVRLDRFIARGDTEALAIIQKIRPLLTNVGGHG